MFRPHGTDSCGFMRFLSLPAPGAEPPRVGLLDVRAVEDRRSLSEIPAAAGRALPRLREAVGGVGRYFDGWTDGTSTTLPLGVTSAMGALFDTVPRNTPAIA